MKIDKFGRDLLKIQHQIDAGTIGRTRGHKFEKEVSEIINKLDIDNFQTLNDNENHIFHGNPAELLIRYIINNLE